MEKTNHPVFASLELDSKQASLGKLVNAIITVELDNVFGQINKEILPYTKEADAQLLKYRSKLKEFYDELDRREKKYEGVKGSPAF